MLHTQHTPLAEVSGWTPEGLAAFCRFVAHWSGATFVAALEYTDEGRAQVIASSGNLDAAQIEVRFPPLDTFPRLGILHDLSSRIGIAPSALAVHFPPRERCLLLLNSEDLEPAQGSLLLLGDERMRSFLDVSLLDYLREVLHRLVTLRYLRAVSGNPRTTQKSGIG